MNNEYTNLFISILSVIICINCFFSNWLDKKTLYKKNRSYESEWFVLLFILFGIFLIPFIKNIKNYRKNNYIKERFKFIIHESVCMKEYPDIFEKYWGKEYEEYQNYFRYKKIKKIKRKINPFYKRILS